MTAPTPEHLPTAIVVEQRPAPSGGEPVRVHAGASGFSAAGAARFVLWAIVAVPALYQIGLLVQAIAGRVAYPYDLEWMEGGMLHHALRIGLGEGIYVAPSVDFIPYLYTPLYPTLLALFGTPFGISYLLGRVISIAALTGIAVVALASFAGPRHRHAGATVAGFVLALGLFAACYPYVEGWYDVVRADTLFLFMITAGLVGLPQWAHSDVGVVGQGKVAAGAAVMALAFFCKQTAIFYVAFGGAIVAVVNWRRAPTYVAVAGVLGLGGTWILNRATSGWFWTYVSEIHRAHDFNIDRFTVSFRNILWHFPAATIVIVVTALVVGATAARTRATPPGSRPFLLWSAAYVVSTVVGAVGWGTEFAHFNAYMPALLHGSLAAGAAVPAMVGCARRLGGERRHTEAVATLCALAAAIPLAVTCATARWQPARFIPTAADVAAGDRLIQHLRSIDGDVWMPSHPWYLQLAGKTPHVHRMGIKDVTTRQTRAIAGLDDGLRNHRFAAIVLDNRDLNTELDAIVRYYHLASLLPGDEQPRLYTGATVVPQAIWLPNPAPAAPAPGTGTRANPAGKSPRGSRVPPGEAGDDREAEVVTEGDRHSEN